MLGTALTGYEVTYGAPLRFPELGCFISELATADMSDSVTEARDETYTLRVLLHAHRTGKTALEMRAIADTGEAAVLAALDGDPTLAGAVSQCRHVSTERDAGLWDERGTQRFADRLITLQCRRW